MRRPGLARLNPLDQADARVPSTRASACACRIGYNTFMPRAVVATSNTLKYPQGGHVWVYLNWALSLVASGYEVAWLDMVEPGDDVTALPAKLEALRDKLRPFGLADAVLVVDADGRPHEALAGEAMPAVDGDLLLNLRYNLPDDFPRRFRQSALIDTDPGMVQYAVRQGTMTLAPHDAYFTVGNATFAEANGDFLATGLRWHATPPAVSLDHWPVVPVPDGAAWSTVSHWYMDVWMVDAEGEGGGAYMNDKRTAFEPYLHLPCEVDRPMTLALNLNNDPEEEARLQALGWRVREAHDVGGLDAYRQFVASSLGEFSCCKPSYRRLNTGWISDRTACYLASGRPCVVEWSGDRPDLNAADGLIRFRTPTEAAAALRRVAADYEHHASAARRLAETHFDGRRCVGHVLEAAGG